MIFSPTPLPGAMIVELERREDERGFFARTFCECEFEAAGAPFRVVQTSMSKTLRAGTLRGMHFQRPPHGEDKLVRCLRGAIWDVIVDLRPDSPTFCRWIGVGLDEDDGSMLLVPKGFAHGFVTLTDDAVVGYLMSTFHVPGSEAGVRFDDPAFGIEWPVPIREMSDRDRGYPDYERPHEAPQASPNDLHSTGTPP